MGTLNKLRESINSLEEVAEKASQLGTFDISGKVKAAEEATEIARRVSYHTLELFMEIEGRLQELEYAKAG
ncbi:hypothetical protein [Gynuella sunshinyii]|uniref:hypothetical protein n=1 Tax=Gynuella sunshinyii TaxID=1445505 RepID=UPI001185B212|nr:hypothetical protein [Gynuella sunshinyii]